jgi:hypothetical protein
MLVEPILVLMPAIKRGGPRPSRRRSIELHADKGFRRTRVRRYLRRQGPPGGLPSSWFRAFQGVTAR